MTHWHQMWSAVCIRQLMEFFKKQSLLKTPEMQLKGKMHLNVYWLLNILSLSAWSLTASCRYQCPLLQPNLHLLLSFIIQSLLSVLFLVSHVQDLLLWCIIWHRALHSLWQGGLSSCWACFDWDQGVGLPHILEALIILFNQDSFIVLCVKALIAAYSAAQLRPTHTQRSDLTSLTNSYHLAQGSESTNTDWTAVRTLSSHPEQQPASDILFIFSLYVFILFHWFCLYFNWVMFLFHVALICQYVIFIALPLNFAL